MWHTSVLRSTLNEATSEGGSSAGLQAVEAHVSTCIHSTTQSTGLASLKPFAKALISDLTLRALRVTCAALHMIVGSVVWGLGTTSRASEVRF